MPAIQPARLKIQISELLEHIYVPHKFVAQLNNLLFFYADRTRRPGRGGSNYSLIRTYNVSKHVFREIEGAIRPEISHQPDQALAVADALWMDDWLESRSLALMILRWISVQSNPEILTRIKDWGISCKDDGTLLADLAAVLAAQWDVTPVVVANLIESWTKASDPSLRKLGLRVIPPLVKVPSFSHLPSIYKIISPLVQRSDVAPDPDLLAVVQGLAFQSPQETAYFLQKNLAVIDNSGVYVLIRQCLNSFPDQEREDLQILLHQRRNEAERK